MRPLYPGYQLARPQDQITPSSLGRIRLRRSLGSNHLHLSEPRATLRSDEAAGDRGGHRGPPASRPASTATPEELTKILAEKSSVIDALKGTKGDLQQALALLTEQPEAALQTKESLRESSPTQSSPSSGHGPKTQPELVTEEQFFDLDDADKVCTACGGALVEMQDQFESSEMIDVVGVEYRLVEVKRRKYTCKCGGCVETAPGPERAVHGGRYSLDFGLHVASRKYLDHLPLHRLSRMMHSAGLTISPNTLWDQLWALTRLLRPAYDALHERLLSEPIIGLDQTGWPNLDAKGKKPWQMWGFTGPGMATYKICSDKSAATMKRLIGDRQRVILCDMLATHGKVAREIPGVELAACWAHVLRRFREVAENYREAEPFLGYIHELYQIDERARTLEEKAELRQSESKALLGRFFDHLCTVTAPRTTELGQAIRYALGHRVELSAFLGDPRIGLDNNPTERALRGPVVGRKNHYGSKSKAGTEAAAIYYSLLETAKLQGVNPDAYLREVAIGGRRGEIILPGNLA